MGRSILPDFAGVVPATRGLLAAPWTPLASLLYRPGRHHCMVPSREAVSLPVAAPVRLSSKDLLGGSSCDGNVKDPPPRSPHETANSPVISTGSCPRLR